MQRNEIEMTPQEHAQHIATMLQQAQKECRADIGRVNDGKAQALFETLAEVLGGAITALDHYQHGSEAVWRSPEQPVEPPHRPLPTHQRPPLQGPQPPVVTDMAPDIDEREPPEKMFTE